MFHSARAVHPEANCPPAAPPLRTPAFPALVPLGKYKEWGRRPMRVVPDERGLPVVTVRKEASEGIYPVEYTLRHPGRYGMIVADAEGRVRIRAYFDSRVSNLGRFATLAVLRVDGACKYNP